MSRLKSYAMLGLTLVSLASCRPATLIEQNMPEANGYDVAIQYYDKDRRAVDVRIGKLNEPDLFDKLFKTRSFSEQDLIFATDGLNGEFKIRSYASKGSPLEELVSQEKIYRILKKFQERQIGK